MAGFGMMTIFGGRMGGKLAQGSRATEFAQKSRGAAMSLVAFFFMGGGGVGTAIGGRLIARFGLERLFGIKQSNLT